MIKKSPLSFIFQFHLLQNNQCLKCFRIRSFSCPYFPAFGLNTDIYRVNLRIQSACGKIRTRKTPNIKFRTKTDTNVFAKMGRILFLASFYKTFCSRSKHSFPVKMAVIFLLSWVLKFLIKIKTMVMNYK